MRLLSTALLFAGLASSSLSSQGRLHRVDATGGGDFRDLPEAVAAARGGDVLLVAEGSYSGFTLTSKALSVVAEPGASVHVRGPLVVEGLDSDETVLLAGFSLVIPADAGVFEDMRLQILGNQGRVLVQSVVVVPEIVQVFLPPPVFGPYGMVEVDQSDAVVFLECRIQGGAWKRIGSGPLPDPPALQVKGSRIAWIGGEIEGRTGLPPELPGTTENFGSDAIGLFGGLAFVSEARLVGGDGGEGFFDGHGPICGDGGDGGDGIEIDGGALAIDHANMITPGEGGPLFNFLGLCTGSTGEVPGDPGLAVNVVSGTHESLSFPPRHLRVPTVLRPGTVNEVVLEGVPGDLVIVLVTFYPVFRFVPSSSGVLLAGSTGNATTVGTIPTGGQLTIRHPYVDASSLPLGFEGQLLIHQAYFWNPVETFVLSNPQGQVVVRRRNRALAGAGPR